MPVSLSSDQHLSQSPESPDATTMSLPGLQGEDTGEAVRMQWLGHTSHGHPHPSAACLAAPSLLIPLQCMPQQADWSYQLQPSLGLRNSAEGTLTASICGLPINVQTASAFNLSLATGMLQAEEHPPSNHPALAMQWIDAGTLNSMQMRLTALTGGLPSCSSVCVKSRMSSMYWNASPRWRP